MIPLGAHGIASNVCGNVLGRVSFEDIEFGRRDDHILAIPSVSGRNLRGYAGVLINEALSLATSEIPTVHSVKTDHLQAGDVVSFDSRGYVRTLYRKGSPHNAIFATDRCNSYCLMCSQPPKNIDDQWRVREHLRLIELIDPETRELGITGGEPTLLRDGLIEIIKKCKERLPSTALHILSNGRLFSYGSFARKIAEIGHPDLMIGVPLYADSDVAHDHVVQAIGAFDETMLGLQHLGRWGIRVEIRVVLHALTWRRLPEIAEFIYRNLTFAAHVTFMGLELMGFAVPNLDLLWVDPWDYRDKLAEATLFMAGRGVPVSVYNHQLCTVPETIWPYCRQSISDWKNEYLPICADCAVRQHCGGFFMSAVNRRYSAHIRPISHEAATPWLSPRDDQPDLLGDAGRLRA